MTREVVLVVLLVGAQVVAIGTASTLAREDGGAIFNWETFAIVAWIAMLFPIVGLLLAFWLQRRSMFVVYGLSFAIGLLVALFSLAGLAVRPVAV